MNLIFPENLSLKPFQEQLLTAQLENDSPYIYDAAEMGLGKGVMGPVYANTCIGLPKRKVVKGYGPKVLIVSPAALNLNWAEEAAIWMMPHIEYFIVSYSLLVSRPQLLREIMREEWDLIIYDEFHMCKSIDAKRTLAAFQLWCRSKRGIRMASGTPMPKACAVELYPVLHAVTQLLPGVSKETKHLCSDIDIFGKYFSYRYIGFNGEATYRGINRHHSAQLADILYSELKLMYVMTQEEAGIDLPEMTYRMFPLNLNVKTSLHPENLREFVASYNDSLEVDLENGEMPVSVTTLRRQLETAIASSKDYHDLLRSYLEADLPIVVICAHTEPVRILEKVLKPYKVVKVTGAESKAAKHESKRRFQDGRANVLIGNIDAAGVGITLTRSCNILFTGTSWNPGPVEQCVKRILRIGQDKPCTATFPVTKNKFHREVIRKMIEKFKNLQRVL